jgi:surface antigen
MSYVDFKNRWSGRRIDYDHVYAYQCVDLILIYIKEEFGLASGVWGNAIDYWFRPSPALLGKFSLVSGSNAQQGDIVVLYGLPGNPYGHIGICESVTATTINILEQNGAGSGTGTGRDAISVRGIPKSRVAGLLRPKAVVAPPPAPPAARSTVFLPGNVQSWRLYRVGSYLRPNTSDQIARLAPAQFGGLTYKIEAWVGDYAVVITTQMFGRGVIWVKGTEAQIR